jgi:ribosomal protein S18 acetylase RimI-like enzyme
VGHIMCSDRQAHYHIEGLAIDPIHRGKGFGKKAIQKLCKLYSDKEITLFVHPHNIPAIISYLKCGFIVRSYEVNKFGDGEDRLFLKLSR